ncbi:carboxylating nicotinate-nucleotide diphosphorylase [Alicyclobacillus acidiphilus]|uniref:carboxylating nicotinate-nucleotide diphosphorylase n=1 Tax=Alicyclobacillus acidiphilus TaxID=182455 RepID=UPI000836DB57|nr:carboxylating nicotinate-nucleotide diphosphorylase [Alicyclobacillus acidiphilus]
MFIDTHTKALIQLALTEDLGRGDCTTESIIDGSAIAKAIVLIKESSRIAGLPIVQRVFEDVDPGLDVTMLANDGDEVEGRAAVCVVTGKAQSILSAERTALNFLARLTGIATRTREAVRLLDGTGAALLDTRKTTPGWRSIEKYAVKVGGGRNHRYGLDDMVLIKDNHIAMAGDIREAVRRARQHAALSQKIEVEVDTLEQLEIALESGADMILLDNMDTETLREAVRIAAGRVPLEASGNMTLGRLREVAETGVNYISMGALTHSATSVDVGLDLEPVR